MLLRIENKLDVVIDSKINLDGNYFKFIHTYKNTNISNFVCITGKLECKVFLFEASGLSHHLTHLKYEIDKLENSSKMLI